MTPSVAMPSHFGALSAGNFMAALLLAAAFFSHCMKMSSVKDVSSALNRRTRESFGSRNCTAWLARKQTRFLHYIKKAIMPRD